MATRGFENVTPAEMKRLMAQKQPRGAQVTRSKYGATPTTVDGIRFDSVKEAARYKELKLRQLAGEIYRIELQPRFELRVRNPDSPVGSVTIGAYRGDFSYYIKATHTRVVEDVKGFKTPLYRWKKKHVEAQYGIQILET